MSIVAKAPAPSRHSMTRSVPRWSPDGSQLLVEVGRRPTVLNRELKTLAELGPEDAWLNYPDWSPDGERITYSYRDVHQGRNRPHWGVFSCNPDGTDVKTLSTAGWRAQWSPDSSRIAYHIAKYEATPRVGMMDRDGGNKRVLDEDSSPGAMSWSPDSQTLVFESWGADGAKLFTVDVESGKKEPLLKEPGESDKGLAFAPDGETALFERYSSDGRRTELRLLDLDTGEDQAFLAPRRHNHDVAWSPDGSQIAFCAGNETGNFDLYLADADGSNLRQITDTPGDEFAPAWSPDGRSLAYYHYDYKGEDAKNRKSVQIKDL